MSHRMARSTCIGVFRRSRFPETDEDWLDHEIHDGASLGNQAPEHFAHW
jgi:hypothetical protein